MDDDVLKSGVYSIPAPRPEEDAASSYQAIDEDRADVELMRWLEEDTATPPEEVAPTEAQADVTGLLDDIPDGKPNADAPADDVPDATGKPAGWADVAASVAGDVIEGGGEAPGQVVGGIMEAINEAGQFLDELLPSPPALQITDPETGEFDPKFMDAEALKAFEDAGGEDIFEALIPDEPDSVTGGLVRSTSQFMAGFLPALGALKGVKGGAIVQGMLAGGVADAVVFDPNEDRLSTWLNEVPSLEPFVSDYLASNDPDDSTWEGRFKNALEGTGMGLGAEAAGGLFRALKYYKAQRKLKKEADTVGAQAEAGRDAIKQAAHEELVSEVTDEDLLALGDPNGPALVRGFSDETSATALERVRDGAVRSENQNISIDEGITAYHRTDKAFDKIDFDKTADGVFWLSTSKKDLDESVVTTGKGEDIEVRISPNARFAGYEEMDRLTTDQMIAEGFDGVKLDDTGGEGDQYQIFNPDVVTFIKDGQIINAAEPKVFINHARLQTGDDIKQVLQELADADADAINAKKGGKVVTNAQTKEASAKEYQEIEDLLGRDPGPMTASQSVAARELLVASGEQIVDMAKRAQSPDASKADLYNFRRGMAVHYAIQSEVIAARAETARALQAWAIPASAGKLRSQAINDLITQNGGGGDLQSLAKAVATVGDNPTALNTMARELGKGRFTRAAYQVWINGLLSSPKTHAVNIMSNSMVALWAIPERYLSAGISKAFYDGEIDTGEIGAQAFGMVKGIRDGIRLVFMGNKAEGADGVGDVFDAFGKVENHGNDFSAEAFGLDVGGSFGRGIDMLGKFINAPGSALQAEDKFFKSIGYRMELQALAHRTAVGEGLEGKEFAERVSDILNNPPDNLKADALDVAHYQTFTQELGKTGQAIQKVIRKVPGARVVVPFIRTPTNILKYTLSRTPLAYLSGQIRADIKAGGARAAQAHARVALGSMTMLTVIDMAMEGTITGGGPLDPKLRNTQRETGWMPYSIKVGDRWYNYSRTDPIGMIMGLGADMSEIMSNANGEDADQFATAGVVALAGNLANKTYLSGLFDFMAAIDQNNPTSDPGKYLTGLAGSMMPYSSFLRNVATSNDTILRDGKDVKRDDEGNVDEIATYLQSLVNAQKRMIPGMSDSLPPRRDLFGKPIDRASGLGWAWDFISPIASKVDDPDATVQAILDNKVSIPNVPRVVEGVKLNAEEYDRFQQLAGEPLKEQLDRLVKSAGFKKMSDGPDGMKAQLILNTVNRYRSVARARIMQEFPRLQQFSFNKKLERVRNLQGETQ